MMMGVRLLQETCTSSVPKALARYGHDWETAEVWGVLIGVSRCGYCNALATHDYFPIYKQVDQSEALEGENT